jgi:hypothetical protein
MTKDQVKRISDLYKLKSELLDDLSKLTSVEQSFHLCIQDNTYFSTYGPPLLKCSRLLSKEIKEIVLIKLQLEIDKVDLELTNIKC